MPQYNLTISLINNNDDNNNDNNNRYNDENSLGIV
jgi:hypothetical protein